METIRIPRIMQETSKRHIQKGKTIGFVPTMGALHDGHISLVKQAKNENDIVVASIFVNPIQFGPKEDFDSYPRDMEGDMEKLQKEGVDILFMPDNKGMYSERFSTYIDVREISDKLCGAFRHGHFTGVATVVCKLFNIVKPSRAYFGQKDFQQTTAIKRMVEDTNMDVEIVLCPTIREKDGLAMSSRNIYLSSDERAAAAVIYDALLSASQLIKSGGSNPADVKKHMINKLMSNPFVKEIQYAGVYDMDTLEEITEFKKENLLAIAVRIGKARLIDNMIVEL
jgi:pantoate--beta-alanine ligase